MTTASATPAADKVVKAGGDGKIAAGWIPSSVTTPAEPNSYINVVDDFVGARSAFFYEAQSGAGAYVNYGWTDANREGIATLHSGSATSGRASLGMLAGGSGNLLLGNGQTEFEFAVRLPALSDNTNTFTVRFGFLNELASESSNGVYFRYTHSANSGKFEMVTRSSATETATDSGTTVVANTWYKLKAVIAAAGGSVTWYVNGAQVGSAITTNIPTGSSKPMNLTAQIVKSAGTTERRADIDWIKFTKTLTSAR